MPGLTGPGPLRLPTRHRLAQLEEGHDTGRDRQPEGDQAEGENGGEHLRLGTSKSTKAPIIPASTAPTPAGANGNRLATMPMKKPAHDPEGTWAPKAWNAAHRIPMLAAQEADRAEHREPAARGVADEADGGARAACEGGGPAGQALRVARESVAWANRASRRSTSSGIRADQQEDRHRGARQRRRDDLRPAGLAPLRRPVRSRIPSSTRANM